MLAAIPATVLAALLAGVPSTAGGYLFGRRANEARAVSDEAAAARARIETALAPLNATIEALNTLLTERQRTIEYLSGEVDGLRGQVGGLENKLHSVEQQHQVERDADKRECDKRIEAMEIRLKATDEFVDQLRASLNLPATGRR